MTKWRELLGGIFPPIMTPFESSVGPVLYEKLAENIAVYNETSLKGYMPLGSNGEFRSLTDEESIKVLETVISSKSNDKTVIAGAGRESAYAASEFIKRAADAGADFASLLPPHYFVASMNSEALIRFYTAVADSSPIPIMIYNIPKFASGLTVGKEVISAMAPHPNVAGLKDSSSEDIGVYVNAVPDGAEFHVLSGSTGTYYKAMLSGCVGGVLSMANYLPRLICGLHELAVQGESDEAGALYKRICELSANAAGKYGPAGVKAAMDLLGLYGGPPRNPLAECTHDEKVGIKRALAEAGYL